MNTSNTIVCNIETPPPMSPEVGSIWKSKLSGSLYILCSLGNGFACFNLENGRRYDNVLPTVEDATDGLFLIAERATITISR